MRNDGKEDLILIRIQKNRKESWKKICKERNITLTNLIIASVENRILEDERKKILILGVHIQINQAQFEV